MLKLRLFLLALILAACRPAAPATEPQILRLATTTSTDDSGLLDAILPAFAAAHQARVDVVAVGTGQALALGRAGDVDVVLVHVRALEDAFVAEGHGLMRADVMYNDFILVGPPADPAQIAGMTSAAEALAAIAALPAPFASRGDSSGAHARELELWAAAGVTPDTAAAWYASLGQGMGATLRYADETGAYTLTDRGTFLAQQANLPGLQIMVGGAEISQNRDPALRNPYGVIPVNPDKGRINSDLAQRFVEWLISEETQQAIGEYGRDRYGQPLFYPGTE